ncbi:hypothetical protein QQX10_11425 [Demequina sp. SYSU T00039]|uniref:Uncharacterized protein n=1 Tax=Demequina lignilytica TaxID=3051663 RepID=A0AAW7M497_9MICO|nr:MULTISPECIES: hypothetical protein [unclassified Demequina]MDN4478899.1 hypothetical protein [Demequina sp. SYSU T00039-1]MDN4488774.1 hypothetical protein [Demequina sp. SYSU T00039]MDN4491842.1 hypothetical protein [Demequina sp. SYSU T00068]
MAQTKRIDKLLAAAFPGLVAAGGLCGAGVYFNSALLWPELGFSGAAVLVSWTQMRRESQGAVEARDPGVATASVTPRARGGRNEPARSEQNNP